MRAIAESCNVWFYKLGHRLEVDRIAEVASQFGLGLKTGVDLPGESAGTMPSSKWKWENFHEKWYPGETLSVSIGQGSVKASPIQMAVACAGVADMGNIRRPFLLDQVIERGGKKINVGKKEVVRKVDAPEEAFTLVKQAMHRTVTNGTGRICDVEGVTVGGKTGSAQAPGGVAHGWFIAFAPVENPEIAIACIIERGAHGSSSAAPVCRAILDVYFGKKKPEEIEPRGH